MWKEAINTHMGSLDTMLYCVCILSPSSKHKKSTIYCTQSKVLISALCFLLFSFQPKDTVCISEALQTF